MTRYSLLAGTAIFLGLSASAYAQGVRDSNIDRVTGTTRIEDTIEDIEEDTQDQFEQSQDEARFGTSGIPLGFRGSVFASGTTTSGNTSTTDFGLGGRFTLGQGRLNHTFGVAAEYGEADDDRDQNRIYGIYDLTYDITDRVYGFGLARAQYDEFSSPQHDYFLGVGPGYRVFNDPGLAWRVQAGPGVRYTKDEFDDGSTEDDTEIAGILSSRFFYTISPSAFVTNDTDVIYSEAQTTVSNDLGVNVSLTGPFSLRTGLRTEYNSDPIEDDENFDNSLTAAVVYSFQ